MGLKVSKKIISFGTYGRALFVNNGFKRLWKFKLFDTRKTTIDDLPRSQRGKSCVQKRKPGNPKMDTNGSCFEKTVRNLAHNWRTTNHWGDYFFGRHLSYDLLHVMTHPRTSNPRQPFRPINNHNSFQILNNEILLNKKVICTFKQRSKYQFIHF